MRSHHWTEWRMTLSVLARWKQFCLQLNLAWHSNPINTGFCEVNSFFPPLNALTFCKFMVRTLKNTFFQLLKFTLFSKIPFELKTYTACFLCSINISPSKYCTGVLLQINLNSYVAFTLFINPFSRLHCILRDGSSKNCAH